MPAEGEGEPLAASTEREREPDPSAESDIDQLTAGFSTIDFSAIEWPPNHD